MCTRVECRKCGKPGFKGCGAHVEQVLAGVPAAERCRCHESAKEQRTQSRGSSTSWLDKVRNMLGE